MYTKGGFMKNKSLFFQIGIAFAGVIIGLSLLLALFFPIILREFFTNEVYSTIEGAQNNIIKKRLYKNLDIEYSNVENNMQELDIRSVTHIQIPKKVIEGIVNLKITKIAKSLKVDRKLIEQIIKQGEVQDKSKIGRAHV